MPLIKSGSKAAVSKNISEFHTGPTYAHTLSKFGKARANAQAIAVALSNARKYKADGGAIGPLDITPPSLLPLPRRRPILDPPLPQRAPIEARLDQIYRGEQYDDSPTYEAKIRALGSRMKGKGVYGTPVYTPKHPKDEPGREIHPMTIAPPEERYLASGGRILRYARGGTPHYGGLIKSAIPGRTDKIPLNVPSGSYIVPADIPSAVGQGNTEAGSQILSKMFKIGPYGSGMTGAIHSGRPFQPKFDWMRFPRVPRQPMQPRQEGGETGEVPIIAAGGEMVIPPHVVKEIGNGDLKAGHRVLDALVLSIRKQHINTLKKLKPPKK